MSYWGHKTHQIEEVSPPQSWSVGLRGVKANYNNHLCQWIGTYLPNEISSRQWVKKVNELKQRNIS